MLRTLTNRILGILTLVLVLYSMLPVFPPDAAAIPAGEAVLRGGGSRPPHA